MVLAVDIGNTNVVIGAFCGDRFVFTERLATDRLATALEYAVSLRTVLELHGTAKDAFEGCIISSVVPPVTQTVREAVVRILGKDPLIVGAGIKTGLMIRTDNPAQIGSDRVCDAVGAAHCYPAPVIIADLGTATTVSVVSRDCEFLGGLIIPGLRVSLDSLSSKASQLPAIDLEPPKSVIGKNTVDCMRSGIVYHTASGIDGIIGRIEEELGMPCTAVATGGLACKIVPYCKRKIILDEALQLKGLIVIYNKNQK